MVRANIINQGFVDGDFHVYAIKELLSIDDCDAFLICVAFATKSCLLYTSDAADE